MKKYIKPYYYYYYYYYFYMAEKIGIRTATIVIKDNRLLLVNSKYSDGDYYLFPGGGLESNETIEEGAIRETLEETGVEIKIEKLIHINEFIYSNDWNKRSLTIFFLAKPISIRKNNLTDDGGKIKQVEWVDISKLDEIDIRPRILADILMKAKGDFDTISLNHSVDYKHES
ncbi:NUDIX hydrolase [archaeon]|nr:NUDIX hydrolase [archaeon]MBT7297354.1 NUDIX hydrolase [archaeon]